MKTRKEELKCGSCGLQVKEKGRIYRLSRHGLC